MNTEALKKYLDCKQAVDGDAKLSATIAEYEALVAKVVEMAARFDYDPAEASACASDAEHLSDMLVCNPKIVALQEAQSALKEGCASCTGCCGGCGDSAGCGMRNEE